VAGVERAWRGRLFYGWIVVAVTFLTLLAAAGVRSAPGVLMVPLEREFGWTRTAVSLAVAINLLLYGLFGPFAAALMDRLGVRRVMLASLAFVAAGVGLTVFMRAPWQLDLLWGVVVGSGTGAMALVLGAYVANRWFVERRGLVMGLLTASSATGQLLFLPVLASLVVAHGWRTAVLATSGATLLIVPLVAIFMRSSPQEIGLRPLGSSGTASHPPAFAPSAPEFASRPDASESADPIRAALGGLVRGTRSREFWLLVGSFYICGASTNGLIGTHLIPACMESGIPEVTAAGLLAAMGVFDLIGTTASGWLSDRWDSRYLLAWYYGLRGLSLLFLPYALANQVLGLATFSTPFAFGPAPLGLIVFAVFYGLDWVATVPPTVRLTADIFGKRQVGIMFGWIVAGHQLGAATAAFGAGALRAWLGGYQVSFLAAGLLCLIAVALVTQIGASSRGAARPPRPAEVGAPV
jgi:MFS family permease